MDDVIEERGATLHLNPGVCVLVAQSCLTVCNPLDPARQDLLSMGFSRQGYQSGLPFPPPEDLPDSGIRSDLGIKSTSPSSLAWQVDALLMGHRRRP